MKTRFTVFSLIIGVLMINAGTQAQSRDSWSGRDSQRSQDDRDRNNDDNRDRNNYDNNDHSNQYHHDNNWNDNNRRDDRYQSRDRYSNNGYDRHNSQRRGSVVYHNSRPRYVYYRDYDVYYDCRNNTYISHSGRRWIVSQMPPRNYRHINWRSLRGYEVNYWDDDFPVYLERRRPGIGNEYRGW